MKAALLAGFLFGLLFNPEGKCNMYVSLKYWDLPDLYSIATQNTVLFNKTDDFIVSLICYFNMYYFKHITYFLSLVKEHATELNILSGCNSH
jgi:hypothetical protein